MSSLQEYISRFSLDKELERNVQDATDRIITAVSKDGVKDLAVAFSGGKDSTALLILMTEVVARALTDKVRLHVVFSDTKLELPPLTDAAYSTLSYLNAFCKQTSIDHTIHLTERLQDQSFWVLIIGKGYPPPNRYFRWCTDRLKIQPPRQIFKTLPEQTGLFTGVRTDESATRAKNLKKSCSADGECGLERWTEDENREGLRFYAPLIDWRTCKVWDFLNFWASDDGWPIQKLTETYGTGATRFGCWTCTLIDEDKALQQVTQLEEWSHLTPLAKFRKMLQEESKIPTNRLYRSTGAKGKLTLTFRKHLLSELLDLQDKVARPLISQQEIELIKEFWQEDLPSDYTKLARESL